MTSDVWLAWPRDLRISALSLVELALEEDLGPGDVTAKHFGAGRRSATVRLVARESGVLAGLPLFLFVFRAVAGRLGLADAANVDSALACDALSFTDCRDDGGSFEAGDLLARITAQEALLHGAERTGLNFLQRMSAVAGATARAVALSCGPAVLDTRKTTPRNRQLEKYAVAAGGGRNHRMGLHDAAMVKDNHKEALGGMAAVMAKVAALPAGLPLIVEVDSMEELRVVLEHAAAGRVMRVLLDNFAPEEAAAAVALRQELGGGPDYEISGGLLPEDLANPHYAGVETASLGSITHSAGALDLALEIEAP